MYYTTLHAWPIHPSDTCLMDRQPRDISTSAIPGHFVPPRTWLPHLCNPLNKVIKIFVHTRQDRHFIKGFSIVKTNVFHAPPENMYAVHVLYWGCWILSTVTFCGALYGSFGQEVRGPTGSRRFNAVVNSICCKPKDEKNTQEKKTANHGTSRQLLRRRPCDPSWSGFIRTPYHVGTNVSSTEQNELWISE